MFGMQHTLKQLSGGIAIAAFVAVVAVPSAFSMTVITDTLGGNGSAQATPDAFERAVAIHNAPSTEALPFAYGGQSTAQTTDAQQGQGVTFITDTLGGNGSPTATPDVFERSVAIHAYRQAMQAAQGVVVQSNGSNPGAYVNGGMSAAVAQSNQTSAPASNPSPYLYGGNSAQFTKTVQSPYLYGGDSPRFSTGIQDTGNAPSVTGNPSGTGFSNWGLAGLGAALGAALLLARLLIGGKGPRQPKRNVRTA